MALKSVKAIGLMSGTSLDGIDVALLDTNGETIEAFGPSYFRRYSPKEREIIEAATQAALKWNFEGVAPNIFAQAEEIVDSAHIEAVQQFIKTHSLESDEIDLIGYHGHMLKLDTVYDFRSSDMEQGGQGAPLAPVFHRALVKTVQLEGVTGVLNVGGVSNITIISKDGTLVATDCGPGNGPLDSWMSQNNAGSYDKDGRASMAGTADFALVERWLKREFFQKQVPKSADRWDFDVLDQMQVLSLENGAATLTVFNAMAIKDSLLKMQQTTDNIVVCGGGRLNPTFMLALKEQNIGDIRSAENIGWQGDDIEAQAFAFLAARHVNALPLSYPTTTGVSEAVTGGILAKI